MLVIIEQTTKDTGWDETVTVLLEKQEPPTWADRPYATHVSPDGGTTKFSGHYDMGLGRGSQGLPRAHRAGLLTH